MIEAPIDLPCGVILKNRIVKSGLSEALGDLNNNPTNELISIFKRWSDGGASLLITGNIIVDRWQANKFLQSEKANLIESARWFKRDLHLT